MNKHNEHENDDNLPLLADDVIDAAQCVGVELRIERYMKHERNDKFENDPMRYGTWLLRATGTSAPCHPWTLVQRHKDVTLDGLPVEHPGTRMGLALLVARRICREVELREMIDARARAMREREEMKRNK